jgi:hypothetical protein
MLNLNKLRHARALLPVLAEFAWAGGSMPIVITPAKRPEKRPANRPGERHPVNTNLVMILSR